MSTIDLIFATAGLSGATGYLLAWRIHGFVPTTEAVARYMDRVVAQEDVEKQEQRLRTIAVRSKRTAMPHPESGPPARISRMVVSEGRASLRKIGRKL